MPAMPAPTMATSLPRRSGGSSPSPCGWVIQSSKANGKSGPKMVTGASAVRVAVMVGISKQAGQKPRGRAPHHQRHGAVQQAPDGQRMEAPAKPERCSAEHNEPHPRAGGRTQAKGGAALPVSQRGAADEHGGVEPGGRVEHRERSEERRAGKE